MNIDIVFIGTNNYINFFNKFYDSFNNNFCTDSNKTFHVFTDSKIDKTPNTIIHTIQHEKWPYITLKRFNFIKKYLNEFKSDYCFFIDSDMLAVKPFKFSQLQITKKFIGVLHPGQLISGIDYYKNSSLEKNKLSSAFFDPTLLKTYFQGCLWGGTNKGFKEIVNQLSTNVSSDLENNIVALWHDETHLNKFFNLNYNDVNILHSQFAYPEKWSLGCTPIIIHIEKDSKEYERFSGK